MSNDKRLSNLQNTLTTVAGVVEQLANRLKDLNSQISQLAGNSSKLGKAQGKIATETGKAAEATKKQAEATEKANKASKGFFGNIGKNIKTIISFYGAYQVLNLALTAFRELTVGSAKRAIALEKSLADLRAVAGLTADEVSRLKDVVFEVAGATSLTATEVVSLQKELAKLGSPIEEIAELTRPIALLSQALGEEAGGVAATLKKTLNQFQATAEEADKFANVIT
jgi:methyl-accepting chemotaxis protein